MALAHAVRCGGLGGGGIVMLLPVAREVGKVEGREKPRLAVLQITQLEPKAFTTVARLRRACRLVLLSGGGDRAK